MFKTLPDYLKNATMRTQIVHNNRLLVNDFLTLDQITRRIWFIVLLASPDDVRVYWDKYKGWVISY